MFVIIEGSYPTEREAKESMRKITKSNKINEEPWIMEGRTGRPMVALFETRDGKVAEKKVMEYFYKGIITAIWRDKL